MDAKGLAGRETNSSTKRDGCRRPILFEPLQSLGHAMYGLGRQTGQRTDAQTPKVCQCRTYCKLQHHPQGPHQYGYAEALKMVVGPAYQRAKRVGPGPSTGTERSHRPESTALLAQATHLSGKCVCDWLCPDRFAPPYLHIDDQVGHNRGDGTYAGCRLQVPQCQLRATGHTLCDAL